MASWQEDLGIRNGSTAIISDTMRLEHQIATVSSMATSAHTQASQQADDIEILNRCVDKLHDRLLLLEIVVAILLNAWMLSFIFNPLTMLYSASAAILAVAAVPWSLYARCWAAGRAFVRAWTIEPLHEARAFYFPPKEH